MKKRAKVDPEQVGTPWDDAFDEFANPKLREKLIHTKKAAFRTIELLAKKDPRWGRQKYFPSECLSPNFPGEKWLDAIDYSLKERDKGIQVIHAYRHAYGLLFGWFLNQLRKEVFLGFTRPKAGGFELINPKEWGIKSWFNPENEILRSRIDANGNLYLDGERSYDLHLVDPKRPNKASAHGKPSRKHNPEKDAVLGKKIEMVLAKARKIPGTTNRARAEELARDKSLGFGTEAIRKILARDYSPMKHMELQKLPKSQE